MQLVPLGFHCRQRSLADIHGRLYLGVVRISASITEDGSYAYLVAALPDWHVFAHLFVILVLVDCAHNQDHDHEDDNEYGNDKFASIHKVKSSQKHQTVVLSRLVVGFFGLS